MQVNSHVDAAAEKQITMTMDSTTNHVIPTSNRVSGILILLFLPYDNMKDGREAVFVGVRVRTAAMPWRYILA